MNLCWISWIWANIIEKLWPAFVAVVLTLWVNQKFIEMRKPRLEMVPEGVQPGVLQNFEMGIKSPYDMWRIKVQHTKISRCLAWLIRSGREPALQCKADLTFYNSKDQALFTMQGRWANTPQISLISPSNRQEKIIYPDTISIGQSPEPLDCIVNFDNENVAYGWNNEAYETDGRNPRYKLKIGTYKVAVRLSGQNFQQSTTKFNFVLAEDKQGISLTLAKDRD